ncbi:MAG: adenosylcobinamide-GDP ribazoletransferase [Candidatus Helarchaeota archaeon]
MFKGLRNSIAFLTKIPVGMDIENMDDLAKGVWLFPVIGMLIGTIGGLIGFFLYFFLPNLLVGSLILAIILFLTGLHHTDGLLDFGDGVMAHGTPEKKIEIMHDINTGTGGIVLGIIVLLITAVSYSYLNTFIIFGVIIAEITAKLGMLEIISFSKRTSPGSKMAKPFIGLTKPYHYFMGLIVTFILLFFLNYGIKLLIFFTLGVWYFPIFGFIMQLLIILVCSFVPSFIIYLIAKRNFNGMSGDSFGAINDISRMFTLVILVFLIQIHFLVY